jgi:hypothetical protein
MPEWTEIYMSPPKEWPEHWIMYFDSTLNLKGAGAGVLLISPMGEQLKYVLQIVTTRPRKYHAIAEITLHSNKDRHICIKTHAKVSPEYIT